MTLQIEVALTPETREKLAGRTKVTEHELRRILAETSQEDADEDALYRQLAAHMRLPEPTE